MPREKELLIEIYSEEIPARMQQKAVDDFRKIFAEFFIKQNIKFAEENLKTFITPRRLVLLVQNLDIEQISPAANKMGPKIDAPAGAIQGFIKSVGVSDINDLEKITRDNGEYYFYKQPEIKINTAEILEKNLHIILQKMSGTWIKSMDLIDLKKQSNWVRPIRNILAIFNGKVLSFEFANLKSNNQTFGHLLAGKKPLQILDFIDYKNQLEESFVILDWAKRREIIVDEIKKIDPDSVEKNSKLIDEITGLVEYPQVLIGKIDDQFKDLPEEVLELTIKLHQKAILFKNKNSLNFIFVSNVKTNEFNIGKIIADNEKVVRARLSDAKFYIEEDLKIPFKSRVELLKNIIFHKKLGSLYDKVKRLEILNKFIVIWVADAKLSMAERLADLSKNDLTTKTVAELTELQGVVGKYYAKIQGEPEEISVAIAEQYLPTGQNSELPQTPLGIVAAISDKVDNICSLFLADEKPTASKDPFALRRAALGIIKIIFESKISLPLKIVVDQALNTFPSKALKTICPDKNNAEIKEIKTKLSVEIIQFFIERNKVYLKDQFVLRSDIVNQVFEEVLKDKNNKKCDLLAISQKAIFINQFIGDAANLKIIELYKRASNIVAIEEKKDGKKYDGKISLIALKTKYERLLYKKVRIVNKLVKKDLKHNDLSAALLALSDLELPIKGFFDNVEVNCDNASLRINRLTILARIKDLFGQVFDFSKVELAN
ncbi:MAG: glycine--tRNA ligase subunit beta [Pseudomonadota bacterium]